MIWSIYSYAYLYLFFSEVSVKVFGSLFNGLFIFSLGVNLEKKNV